MKNKLPFLDFSEDSFKAVLTKDIYATYDLFESLMGWKEIKEFHYRGIFSIGRFDETWDYNQGLVHLDIKAFTTKYKGVDTHNSHLYIGNVDDGEWEAWGNHSTLEEAQQVVKNIRENWPKEWSVKLPETGKQLNEYLKPYGLYGS